MRRECRERFPRHRLQRKPLVSGPGLHHGTCVTHVPWCMSGALTPGGGENVPGIPGAYATDKFAYLARGPWTFVHKCSSNALMLIRHQTITRTNYSQWKSQIFFFSVFFLNVRHALQWLQGSFWVWAQPMRGGVTKQCLLSLAESIPE